MKKVLFSLLLMLAVSSTVTAQSKIRFGLRLSPVVSWANTKDSTGAKYELPSGVSSSARMGISYGLTIIYQMADNFGLQTGVNWVDRGYKLKGTLYAPLTTTSYTQKRKLSALEIPILLRLRSGYIGKEELGLKIRGLVGVSADINVSGKVEDSPATPLGIKYSTKWYQPAGASTVFGLGVEWKIDKVGTFDLGASYHKGLINSRLDKKTETNGNWINPSRLRQRYDYVALDLTYLF